MPDDKPIRDPSTAGAPDPEAAAPPPAEGATRAFSLKMESWMTGLGDDLQPPAGDAPAVDLAPLVPEPPAVLAAVPPAALPEVSATPEEPRRRGVVVAAMVALLVAGGAGWYFCGAQLRALLKI
jgi:hypothetical protein